ncbi:radical SAM protein [Romboutsia sp. Marseille-P6047]|uniref:radical SAM protein n=1 Tax=Romboutsia sp. Marseille-P6047 TaxID=2161817 RepID=UPI000F048213|nr:radical SAM protein [Romboutsia sp. Marseille-P6047]
MLANRKEININNRLFYKASRERTPLNGTFELTPLCNLDCKMCYIKMTKSEMDNVGNLRSNNEWLEIAKQAKEEGLLYLLLTGGEVFSIPNFKDLYLELKNIGFIISINSNGTLINDSTIEWLSKSPPSRINITLYGASNETYEKLCGDSRGFDKVSKAIDMLLEIGVEIKLNCSLTPFNIHDLEEIHKFANEKKLVLQVSSYMYPPVRRDNDSIGSNLGRFTAKEAGINFVKNDILSLGVDDFKAKANRCKNGVEFFESRYGCTNINGNTMACRAGKSSFWISWDGKMQCCGMMNYPASYPFKNMNFKDAWKQIVKEVDSIRTSIKCLNCSKKFMCISCPAMAVTETGKLDGTPNYVCEMMNEVLKEMERKVEVI